MCIRDSLWPGRSRLPRRSRPALAGPGSPCAAAWPCLLYTSIADSDAYKAFLNVGQVFNQLARIFSGASSIINNINVIYKSIVELNNLLGGFIKK